MKSARLVLRLMRIHFIFVKHRLDEMILSLHLFRPLRFLAYWNPLNWSRQSNLSRGRRLRCALEDLGPLFVKFGQMMSTRRDMLPKDIANELALLQDNVPPFAGARQVIEKHLGQPIAAVFASFSDEPLASASIAQVHAATLLDGSDVVVKVLRPGIQKMIRGDIELMYAIAKLTRRFVPDAKRFKPVEVVAEFERNLIKEIDLIYEAANASQLRRNFSDSADLRIPKVYWHYARKALLVFERIYGIPILQTERLVEAGVDLAQLAEQGVLVFFTQVFRDSFFHADMHPGNLFVDASTPHRPQLIAVDFGIMGTLSPSDQRYLAENMLAFFNRDYRRVAELHVASNWVPMGTPVNEFESAIRTVCEPVFERPLKEISIAKLLVRLFQTAREFKMEIQPQLTLLQKTLINVEGLGRTLYPDLDLWSTAKPFLERWLRAQMGFRAAMRKSRANLPYWLEKLPDMPEVLYQRMQMAQRAAPSAKSYPHLPQTVGRRRFLQGFALGAFILLAVTTYPRWLVWFQPTSDSFLLGSLTGAATMSIFIMIRQMVKGKE